MKDYTHEDIIRGLVGDKSVKEIINMMLVSIAKLNLRIECIEESIDAIVEELDEEGES
jgi:hypothetical protein